MTTSRAKTLVGLFTLVLGAAGACSNRTTDYSSETNWFDNCETDSDCSVGSCLCGVCTESCTEDSSCPGVYTCAGSGSGAFTRLCKEAASAPAGVCLKGCESGSACAAGFVCESDACVPKARATSEPAGAEQTLSASVWSDLLAGTDPTERAGRCFPRSLPVGSNGQISCEVMAFRNDNSSCRCDEPGFRAPPSSRLSAMKDQLHESGACDIAGKPACDDYCGCELIQKSGSALEACQQEEGALTGDAGWCYLDPDAGAGNPAIVANCPVTQRRLVRVGGVQNQMLTLACTLVTPFDPHPIASPGGMGDPCTPQDEFSPTFNGFRETEVNVESGSPSCSTGICLAASFRGRTSCAYGQPPGPTVDGVTGVDPSLGPDARCYLPGATHEPANEVTVPVDPQLLARSPEKSVYCSCRCDGPAGQGPFCACPSGFECTHLVDDYGTATNAQFAGSYCIKAGTEVPDPTKIPQADCSGMRAPRPAGCGDP